MVFANSAPVISLISDLCKVPAFNFIVRFSDDELIKEHEAILGIAWVSKSSCMFELCFWSRPGLGFGFKSFLLGFGFDLYFSKVAREVNNDENLAFLLNFMASYAHKIPNESDMQDTDHVLFEPFESMNFS